MSKSVHATRLRDQQRQHWARGERLQVETYLRQQPRLHDDPEAVLDLIYNEVVLREEAGDRPQLHEYLQRFPQFAAQLRIQFEVHQAIEAPQVSGHASVPVSRRPERPSPFFEDEEVDLTGRTLGDFRVQRRLGQGAMGQVYLAEQVSLKRPVALKVLRAELMANPVSLRRFRAEAEAVARATHANIVQVYAIGQADGLHYMALEYIEGRNLREYLDEKGPLDVRLALSIMRQVASALHRAEELGIVHRDVKPANILLSRTGQAKVADFGLCRSLADSKQGKMTRTGVTLGTPVYMSPEQIQGGRVDGRSDIYSFGVSCYHVLAGTPPFQGASPFDVAMHHLQSQATPLATVRPDLPGGLCAVVHKMMARKPEERYQNALDLLREIGEVRSSLAGSAADAPASRVVSGPANHEADTKKRRRLIGWLAAAILLLLGGAGAVAWLNSGSDVPSVTTSPSVGPAIAQPPAPVNAGQEQQPAVKDRKDDEKAPELAPPPRPDGGRRQRHGGRGPN